MSVSKRCVSGLLAAVSLALFAPTATAVATTPTAARSAVAAQPDDDTPWPSAAGPDGDTPWPSAADPDGDTPWPTVPGPDDDTPWP